MKLSIRRLVAIALVLSAARLAQAGPMLIVNGQTSNNAYEFDLTTGASQLFATYNSGDGPRNLAVDTSGNIFASLNGGNQNVVKLVPQTGTSVLKSQDFTASVGGTGTGQLEFYQGNLYVAGDSSRVIHEYNGSTGAQLTTFSGSTSFNIRAMTIAGSSLYYAEIFQDRIWKFDLTASPPTGSLLVTDTTHLNDAWNMTVGKGGDLIVANRSDTLIQDFDPNTGAFLGTLANLKNFDPSLTQTWDVVYNSALDNYFASSGNAVYRMDANGQLLQVYQTPGLVVASGLVVVPEPSTAVLIMAGGICAFAFCAACRKSSARRSPS